MLVAAESMYRMYTDMQEFYCYLAFFLLIDPSYGFLFNEASSIVLQVLNNTCNNLDSFMSMPILKKQLHCIELFLLLFELQTFSCLKPVRC